jgi:hypothetical protein
METSRLKVSDHPSLLSLNQKVLKALAFGSFAQAFLVWDLIEGLREKTPAIVFAIGWAA